MPGEPPLKDSRELSPESFFPHLPELKDSSPLHLSVEEAVVMAMERNRDLRIQRLQPVVAGTFEALELARFDPEVFTELRFSQEQTERFPDETDTPISDRRDRMRAEAGVRREFAGGGELELSFRQEMTDSDRIDFSQHQTRAGLSFTQALLQGRGREQGMVSVERARLEIEASQHEFRAFAEALAAEVESTYWEYVLAHREIEIVEAAADLALRQREAMRDRIRLGQTAGVDATAAEAELALRQQALIDTRNRNETLRLRLVRFLNPGASDLDWDREILPLSPATVPDVELEEVTLHTQAALRWRPEIREAELRLAQQELRVIQTRDGLLPQLDFFLTLGKTGFADAAGQSVSNLDGDSFDVALGVRGSFSPRNREADARHLRAGLDRVLAEESITNLQQLVVLDVRTAYAEGLRARAQIQASAATRRLQEELLRSENEKFSAGLATALDVAQVQRDLLSSQLSEAKAVIDFRKALVSLYRLEGTLLQRRGLLPPHEPPSFPGNSQ